MFWDQVAGLYDLFENIYNYRVYNETGKKVAEYISREDLVLECACGTGAISKYIAPSCRKLLATDYSMGMLKQARKKLYKYPNVRLKRMDITDIKIKDNCFDVVVAGNVIHLLPDPKAALDELYRVCKDGGKLIIPTYINGSAGTNKWAVRFLELFGARFKRQFDEKSYQNFFNELGYEEVEFDLVEGRMACEIAVIHVHKEDK